MTVARQLEEDERTQLIESLTTLTGKEILLEEEIDPSIIGGLVVRVDGRIFDGSLQTNLNDLGTTLRTSI